MQLQYVFVVRVGKTPHMLLSLITAEMKGDGTVSIYHDSLKTTVQTILQH
jgi:hypothetical protein